MGLLVIKKRRGGIDFAFDASRNNNADEPLERYDIHDARCSKLILVKTERKDFFTFCLTHQSYMIDVIRLTCNDVYKNARRFNVDFLYNHFIPTLKNRLKRMHRLGKDESGENVIESSIWIIMNNRIFHIDSRLRAEEQEYAFLPEGELPAPLFTILGDKYNFKEKIIKLMKADFNRYYTRPIFIGSTDKDYLTIYTDPTHFKEIPLEDFIWNI